MTVVLLLHPKINAHDYSTAVVLVKNFKTIPPAVISAIIFPGLF